MKITVIIVSFNTKEMLRKCLDSLWENPGSWPLEVFVVDNDSVDDSVSMVRQHFPQVQLIENQVNLGFAAANNQAWQRSSGDYIILLNPDAYIKSNSIKNGVSFMESHPECGLCGGRLIKPDGSLDPSARRFPNALYKIFTLSGLSSRFPASQIFNRYDFGGFGHDKVQEVDWVPGTFTVYRRQLLEQTGLFDERFYLYYEETDLCLQAKRSGWKVYFIPDAEVVHVGGGASKTRKDEQFDQAGSQVLKFRIRSEILYFRKNFNILSALANAGVELGWHSLRYLVNLLPWRNSNKQKRANSLILIRQILQGLKDTRMGAVSPPVPW